MTAWLNSWLPFWLQYGPLLLFILYYLLTAALPAIHLRRRHQVNVHKLDHWRTVHGFLTRMERWILRVVGLVVVFHAFLPEFDGWFLPEESWLSRWHPPFLFLCGGGWVLIGTAIIAIAQQQMGQLWRIDIDNKIDRTKAGAIVSKGLFHFSRNPIYVGTLLVLGGFFLILPSWITLFAVLLEAVVLHYEVQQEEAYLQQQYGEAYLRYCRSTRRWL